MNIVVYVRSGRTSPSSYYRILQYVDGWGSKVKIRILVKDSLYSKRNTSLEKKSKRFWNVLYYFVIYSRLLRFLILDNVDIPECLVIGREMSPKLYLPILGKLEERLLKHTKKVIWDFDDDIFLSKEVSLKESILLEQHSGTIIVTHNGLKNKLSNVGRNKCMLMPTTDGDFLMSDYKAFMQARSKTYNSEIKLLWIATQSSIPNLYSILEYLESAAKEMYEQYEKRLSLHVVCNSIVERKSEYLDIKNIKWSRNIIESAMCDAHIGIMPLLDNEFNRGKGGFKIIQYLSTALPVIASPVGYNCDIVDPNIGYLASNQEEWVKSVILLGTDKTEYLKKSREARSVYDKKYSFSFNDQLWKTIIGLEGE